MSALTDAVDANTAEENTAIAYIKSLADEIAALNANGADVTASIAKLQVATAALGAVDKPAAPASA